MENSREMMMVSRRVESRRRLLLVARVLAASMLICVVCSWKLWLHRPYYPLVPIFDWWPVFGPPGDILLFASLCVSLVATIVFPASRPSRLAVMITMGILFSLDQSRLWPSFYQFFLMFVVLDTWNREDEADAADVIASWQLLVGFVYIWAGVHKLNHYFFTEEFPWFIAPALSWLGPLEEWFTETRVAGLGRIAAVSEVAVGIGLLTRRFRPLALVGATLIHLLILVSIGPLRDNWNNGSWLWGQCVFGLVWCLYLGWDVSIWPGINRAILGGKLWRLIPLGLVVVMPFFNGLNYWDSGLSFNVYSGNKDYAEIHMRTGSAKYLPGAISQFVEVKDDHEVLNIVAWSLHEFHANPFPEARIYATIMRRVCEYLPPDSARLYVRKKATYFSEKRDILAASH